MHAVIINIYLTTYDTRISAIARSTLAVKITALKITKARHSTRAVPANSLPPGVRGKSVLGWDDM